MEKELLLSFAGYNLVRSVQREAARLVNLDSKSLSFSRVQDIGPQPGRAANPLPR